MENNNRNQLEIDEGRRYLRGLVDRMCANLTNGFDISDDEIFRLRYNNDKMRELDP